MSDTKFTKGKWVNNVTKPHYKLKPVVVMVNGGGFDISNMPDAIANAHLIATAPEMYETLTEVSKLRELNCEDALSCILDNTDDILKLLAKARGESWD